MSNSHANISDHIINYSIIVPVHNSRLLIVKLLDTVPSRKDVEVILVDDHSDDYVDILNIVKNHKNSDNIILLKNTGVNSAGAARNVGLEVSRGKWIVFADSDDIFTKSINEVFDKYVGEDADIVLFEATEGFSNKRMEYIKYCFRKFKSGDITPVGLSYRMTTVWSKLYRREAVRGVRFRETSVANDVSYAMKAAFATRRSVVVDTDTSIYRLTTRQESITSTKRYNLKRVAIRVRERLLADAWLFCSSLFSDCKIPSTGRLQSIFRKFYVK